MCQEYLTGSWFLVYVWLKKLGALRQWFPKCAPQTPRDLPTVIILKHNLCIFFNCCWTELNLWEIGVGEFLGRKIVLTLYMELENVMIWKLPCGVMSMLAGSFITESPPPGLTKDSLYLQPTSLCPRPKNSDQSFPTDSVLDDVR